MFHIVNKNGNNKWLVIQVITSIYSYIRGSKFDFLLFQYRLYEEKKKSNKFERDILVYEKTIFF